MKNYYEILEVNPKASFEIIEKAYHTLVKKYHPDMQENEIEKMRSEQILKDLNEAYYVLSNVSLREQYDKALYEQNIRKEIENMYGNENSKNVAILYGGSVKSSNSKDLFTMSDIDGGLVGGASLDAEEFSKIVNYN